MNEEWGVQQGKALFLDCDTEHSISLNPSARNAGNGAHGWAQHMLGAEESVSDHLLQQKAYMVAARDAFPSHFPTPLLLGEERERSICVWT